MSEIVRLDQVTKSVEQGLARLQILRGVSLSVQQGEFLAIMGRSGSGKSTLLNVLGLLEIPTSGTFHLCGLDTSKLQDKGLARLRAKYIGFIFQNFNLLPYLTAAQNIALPLTYSPGQSPGRVNELLGQLGLKDRAHAHPPTLSGGERQRVAIARALLNRPELILADEPTGALDSATSTEILDLLQGLHQNGTTVVVVTHDEAVARLAQRVLYMKDGILQP